MMHVALLLAALTAAGPGGTVAGRVVRIVGTDTVPAVGAMVVLHQVTTNVQGPVDSLRSGVDGAFQFVVTADSGTLLLLSARWHGIDYFSTPARAGDPLDPLIQVMVSDTSSAAVVTVAARHIVIGAPAADGTRSVVDLIMLDNAGTTTRVARTPALPTWRLPLPATAVNVVVGESDFAMDAVDVHGDTLDLHAAIPPGQRQLLVHYQIPPATRQLAIPFDEAVSLTNLLLEEGDTEVRGTLEVADSSESDGIAYRRWSGAMAAGSSLELRFTRSLLPKWWTPALAVAFALALLLVTWRTARKRAQPEPRERTTLQVHLDALAQLDAANAGREAERTPEEWSQYLAARDALKAQVRALLP